MRSAASTSCTTRSRSNTTACRCGRASRATRAAPSARWTSSTATTSSRNGRRSTRGWRPTEGAANDGDRVRTGPHDSPPGHVPRPRQRGGRPDGPRDQGRAQIRVRVLPGLRRLLRRRDAILAHELRRHEPRHHLRLVGQAPPRRRHPADDPGPLVHEVLRSRPALGRQGRRLRADAQCCGVAQMMYCNDKTKGLTAKRMDEATDVDADYLLVACPKCLTHFGCLHHENKWKPGEERYGFKVMDITQFLAERLPGDWPTGSNIDQKRKEPPLPGRSG